MGSTTNKLQVTIRGRGRQDDLLNSFSSVSLGLAHPLTNCLFLPVVLASDSPTLTNSLESRTSSLHQLPIWLLPLLLLWQRSANFGGVCSSAPISFMPSLTAPLVEIYIEVLRTISLTIIPNYLLPYHAPPSVWQKCRQDNS